jgi:hypothetical protein
VYDIRRVRRLCEEIAIEQDSEKAEDLIKLLSAVIREKNEEIVFNQAVLRRKTYRSNSGGAPCSENTCLRI